MSHNPAQSRGAIKAFHHEINYALRKLRGNAPAMAAILAPYTSQLQMMLIQAAPSILPKPAANWPDGRKKTQDQVQHSSMDATCTVAAQGLPDQPKHSTGDANHLLKAQDSDETTMPMQRDVQSCSDTETWGSASPHRRHSRKPRCGRRAKAGLHAKNFEHCSRAASMENNVGVGSASSWNITLEALIETLDESLDDNRPCMVNAGSSSEDSGEDSVVDVGSESLEEIMPTPLDSGTCFAIEVCKGRQEPLGISLEQHAEAIVVSRIFASGAIARSRSRDTSLPNIAEGDLLLSVNGATDMDSIMSGIFSSTSLKIECMRGPYIPPTPSAVLRASVSETQRDDAEVEYEVLQRTSHSEHVCETDLAEARTAAAAMERHDLSKLIAERLARSKRS